MKKQNKTWKKFCQLRQTKINKNIKSKEFLEALKTYEDINENYKSTKGISMNNCFTRSALLINMNMYNGLLNLIKYQDVPDKTYEDYLSWKEGLIKL